jgi:hypothetical protein
MIVLMIGCRPGRMRVQAMNDGAKFHIRRHHRRPGPCHFERFVFLRVLCACKAAAQDTRGSSLNSVLEFFGPHSRELFAARRGPRRPCYRLC